VSRATRLVVALLAAALLGPASDAGATARRPKIHYDWIPFPAKRKREMRSYAIRHYGIHSYRLTNPHVIVEHLTVGDTWQSAYNTFAPDAPDAELHELPGVCSHFVIDQRGFIHQLVPLALMCRHTVGLNYTAIGIEHVGRTDAQVLANSRQMSASLRLTRWLQRRYRISTKNVIGHNESVWNAYHRERVARLRSQTHGDWRHASMVRYRKRLRQLGSVAVTQGGGGLIGLSATTR
jgi:beta-N-acetylhexosaminidase